MVGYNEFFNLNKDKLYPNLSPSNGPKQPKLFIAFSAVPGLGKTFISNKLIEHYKDAIRISSREVNDILEERYGEFVNFEFIKGYTEFLVKHLVKELNISNNPLVLDSSIDRRYEAIKRLIDELGAKLFVIKIKVSREKIIERLTKRESEENDYLPQVDKWIEDNIKFNSEYQADFTIDNDSDELIDFQIQELLTKLESNLIKD